MGQAANPLSGPDLTQGVSVEALVEGKPLLGHAFGEPVLLARQGAEVYAVSANCSHYGAPLAEGLQVGGTIRCPWHHACFDLRTGAATRAPALNPLACYQLEQTEGKVRVVGRKDPSPPRPVEGPSSVVIIGAGAAGHAAAETLRNEGYGGPVLLLGADPHGPYDRPNLSKDYLAGSAPEEWIPLRPPEFFEEHNIALRTGVKATSIEPATRTVVLSDGSAVRYGALVLATGAEPIRLAVPGAELPFVHYLRSLGDCRALIARAKDARRAVVLGASFIGLEAAASLRARGLEVHVVAPESRPLERVLGAELGDFLKSLHEENGVTFHLGQRATEIDSARGVVLESGDALGADLVVVGIGVRPAVELAQRSGLAVGNGVRVSAYLETSVPGVWAAGDIACWPDPRSGQELRVEHWVVAQRQGQTAARNILGKRERFDAVPFFWTTQYGVTVAYVGHAAGWDRAELDGSLRDRSCTVRYHQGGRIAAVATIGRDLESLRAEVELERSPPSELR